MTAKQFIDLCAQHKDFTAICEVVKDFEEVYLWRDIFLDEIGPTHYVNKSKLCPSDIIRMVRKCRTNMLLEDIYEMLDRARSDA